MRDSVEIEIPFEHGPYAVTRWPAEGPGTTPAVAAHGITANGLAWGRVAAALPELDLIAPDLRGRGRSRDVGGPYSMGAHADDLLRTMDHLEVGRALLLGHSMGGWVAATAAARYPDRFSAVLLIDGGLGFPLPPGTDLDVLLDNLLGPAMTKLRTTFASREAFLAPWRTHPSFEGLWSPEVEAYLERDIVGVEPEVRSASRIEAVRDDAADELLNPEPIRAVHALTMPTTFLYAERGLLNEPTGLYQPEVVGAGFPDDSPVSRVFVSDVNHYSILVGDRGVTAVAEAARALIEA